MDASTSAGSSSTHRRSSSLHDRNTSKHTLADLELTELKSTHQHDTEALPPSTPPPSWVLRLERRLASHPRLLRAYLYARGPRPKVDLPGKFCAQLETLTAHELTPLPHRTPAASRHRLEYQGDTDSSPNRNHPHSFDTAAYHALAFHHLSSRIHNRPCLSLQGKFLPNARGRLHWVYVYLLARQQRMRSGRRVVYTFQWHQLRLSMPCRLQRRHSAKSAHCRG